MKHITNLFSDPNLKFERWSQGRHYSKEASMVGLQWKTEKIGFNISILDPKTFSCPYHLHHEEEELFIVIKGSATVRQDDEFFQVNEGDLVFFKIGVAHQFYNHTDQPFRYLALSNKGEHDGCEYPDSNKKLDRKTREITQNGIKVDDYWKDEEDPRSKWPTNIVGRIE